MAKILSLLFIACALASTSFPAPEPLLSQEDIDYINAHSTWTASEDLIDGMTVDDAKARLGVLPDRSRFPAHSFGALTDFIVLPQTFDSRTQWPGCVGAVLDQGQCGDCWAFGAAGSLSDRYCIQKETHVTLSPQWLATCDKSNHGCNGGWPDKAWEYIAEKGIATLECLPYQSENGFLTPAYCPMTCKDNTRPVLYKATNLGGLYDPMSIKMAIMKSGPVEATMTVYADLYAYKTGVYVHKKGRELGGHAVEIVGWGTFEEGSMSYWIVKNSWGTTWGEEGYFNIEFQDCGIDSNCFAGDAA